MVTGNLGYIGSVLVPMLNMKNYHTVGYDTGYFSDNILGDNPKDIQTINKDIREVNIQDLNGINGIIHLAGLSNDPLGELSPEFTYGINLMATVKLAKLAKEAGVKRFVYASSQSMYGISKSGKELDEDNSEKNPVTTYAITKWEAELELMKMHSDDFVVVCFRPSTVFGASPRLRCDIVYNNFVACAYTTGKIEILSDGTPWRPVVHVKDVCQAFMVGLEAPSALVGGKAFNVGIPNGNFTVRNLAEAAKNCVPGCELVFLNEHTDPRTYRVSFNRILNELSDYYQPEWNLDKGGKELVEYFDKVNLTEDDYRGVKCNRLKQLEFLKTKNRLNDELKWL